MNEKDVYQLLEETLSTVEVIRSLYYIESKQVTVLQTDFTDDVKALVEAKKELDVICNEMRNKREAKLLRMSTHIMMEARENDRIPSRFN